MSKFKVGDEVMVVNYSTKEGLKMWKGRVGKICEIKSYRHASYPIIVNFEIGPHDFSEKQLVHVTNAVKVLFEK